MCSFPLTLYSLSAWWSRVLFWKLLNLEKFGNFGYFRYFIQNPIRAEDTINLLCEIDVLAKTESAKVWKANDRVHSENHTKEIKI